MYTIESLKVLNKRLKSQYSTHSDNRPIWRIVWSEDQFERRFGTFEDSVDGIFLRRVTEWREVRKYNYIHDKYILEELVIVPEYQQSELGVKLSYEPTYVYMDKNGNPLPPKWEITEFVINMKMTMRGHENKMAKYTDPSIDPENRNKELQKMFDQLFGNETDVTDALHYREGIVVRQGFKESN